MKRIIIKLICLVVMISNFGCTKTQKDDINMDDEYSNEFNNTESVSVKYNKKNNIKYTDHTVQLDIESKGGFIGFNDDYCYFTFNRFEEKPSFTEYIKYNRKDNTVETVYRTECEAILFNEIYNDKIYIVEINTTQDVNDIQLNEIDLSKDNKKQTLLNLSSIGYPSFCRINNNIIFTYTSIIDEKENKVTCYSINLDNYSKKIIDETSYKINKDGSYIGAIIKSIGGIDNILYYTKIDFINELPLTEDNGVVYLYQYDLNTSDKKFISKLDKVLSYVSGGEDFILTSRYSFSDGSIKSGILYDINKDGIINKFNLPGIEPSHEKNIRRVYRIKNNNKTLIMFCNLEEIYLYDMDKKEYHEIIYNNIKDNSKVMYQVPIVFDNKIGFIENNLITSEVILHEISITE